MVISRLHYDRIHEISDMIIMPGSFFTMSPDNLSLSAEDMLQSNKDKTIIFLCAKYIDFQKYIIFYGHFTATL